MVDSDSSEEEWVHIHEYENGETFGRLYKAAEEQPDLLCSDDPRRAKLRDEKRSLTAPGSSKK
jgi:hypothetical protein